MTRRTLTKAVALGAAARLATASDKSEISNTTSFPLPPGYKVTDMDGLKHFMPVKPEQICVLIYPGMTALDLIAPQQVFGYLMGAKVNLVWKSLDPIVSDTGVTITPGATLKDFAGQADILFVPGGGKGTVALMTDPTVTGFLEETGQKARYVTSVCSGSLLLGAAGLLRGYRATSHWAVREVLLSLGASLAADRVVEDRNRITAGGVTAGLDFGIHLAAKLRGEDYAQALQLMLEYDPHPPFRSGSPAEARADIRGVTTRLYAPLLKSAMASAETARSRWNKG